MNAEKTRQRFAALAVAALLTAVAAHARIGLSSQFVNIVLEGLKVGKNYNLLELRGIPYTIKNRGDAPVSVIVEAERPEKGMLMPGYEPIPDSSWIEVSPNEVTINPGESAFAALTIKIPEGKEYIGRHYHGLIFAHTKAARGAFFSAGVRSNIRFSTGKGPETLAEEERYRAMVELNYDMWPSALYVRKATVGKYDAAKTENKTFLFTNRDENPIELTINPAPWGKRRLNPGYEKLNDLSWIRFEPSLIKVDPLSLKKVHLKMDIPKEYAGRKFAFTAILQLPIGTIVNNSHRIFVEVAKDGEATITTEENSKGEKK